MKQENIEHLIKILTLIDTGNSKEFSEKIRVNAFQEEFLKVTNEKKPTRITTKNKQDPDTLKMLQKNIDDKNYFKFFLNFDESTEFIDNENKNDQRYLIKRRLSKVSAAYSIAKYFSFNIQNEKIDSPTLISYFSITKFLFAYRFIESFRKLLYIPA